MKKCKGCGRYDNQPLGLNKKGEPYLACCPNNDYVETPAIDWLVEKFFSTKRESTVEEIIEQAKAIAKQQTIDSFVFAYLIGEPITIEDATIAAEKYYNETYDK